MLTHFLPFYWEKILKKKQNLDNLGDIMLFNKFQMLIV
jgi:hypothetical protein